MTEENDLLVDIVESEHHTRALPVVKYDGIDCSGIKINKTDKHINNEPVYTIDAIYNEDTVVSATINKNTGEIECNIPNDESERKILFDKILSHHIINNGAVKNGMEPLPLILCVALSVANIKDKFRIYYQAGYDYNFDGGRPPDDYYKEMSDGFKKVYNDTDSSEINYIINVLGMPGNGGHIDILTRSNNRDLLFDTQLTNNVDKIPYNEKIRPMYDVVIYKKDMVKNGDYYIEILGFKDGCDESNILVKKQLQGPMSCFLMCLSYIECIKTGKIPEDKIEEYFADGRGQLLVMEQAFNFVNKEQKVFKINDDVLSSCYIDVVDNKSNAFKISDDKKDFVVLNNNSEEKNVTISDVIDINGANEVLELLYTNKLIEKVNELPKEAVCGEGYKEKEVEKNAGVVAPDKEEQVGYKTRNSKDCFCALL